MGIQLRESYGLGRIGIHFRITPKRFRHAFIFVRKHAGKRVQQVRSELSSLLFGKIEREFFHFEDCGHVAKDNSIDADGQS